MIKQRILYVGIGGSGIDLGIELDSALKREICGLDGNALGQKGMPYRTNELPPFVQQVYIDFAAAAVASVSRKLVGSSARTITGIIPAISSYAGVANALRLHNIDEIQSWVPGPDNEPAVNPLSAGAGQYPTVGRAAMFQSIQGQGLDQAILNPIRDAIASLSSSMGDLMTYTGNSQSDHVAVYVGFSASGGTGAGLFYDVLLMLIDELTTHMTNTPVVVMPAVLLPSTFDGVLPPVQAHRAKLNASTALVDLANMIEQMSRMDLMSAQDFDVVYPNSGNKTYSLINNTRTVQMPVAAVISSTPGMTRDDTVRMLASAIVTQVSLSGGVGGDGQVQNNMTFGENVVNWSGIITMDPSSVMHKPLMPMVSASLTVPSRKIADIVAKRLLHQAFTSEGGVEQVTEEQLKDLGNRILKACGLASLVEGETFRGSYNVGFTAPAGIKSENDLREKISRLNSQIDTQAIPVIQTQIAATIRTLTTFDILEGMEQILGSDSSVSLPTVAAAAQNALARLNLSDTPVAHQDSGSVARRRAPKKSKLKFLPGKRLTQQAIRQEFELVEKEFKERVHEMWWQEWARCKHQWRNSVNTGQNRVADLSSWWASVLASALDSAQSGAAAVATPRLGVKDFVPTRGVSVTQALENIFSDTKSSLLATRPLEVPTTSNLVQSVLGEGKDGNRSALRNVLSLFRNNRSQHDFNEGILECLRSEVHSVFSRSVDGQQPVFSSLSSLLEEMIHSSPGSDAQTLKSELGNLVPGVMVPHGEFKQASVNITYPGNTNREIEEQIAELVFSSGAMRELISAGPADVGSQILRRSGVSIAAAGDSDSLTVNINLVGQTLFGNDEVCGVLQAWQQELDRPDQEKIKWRQRLGYNNMDRILTGHSRTRTLHKLLVGLWGGQIEIASGTYENPQILTVFDNNRQLGVNSLPQLTLVNGWTDLMKSFERLQMDLDRQGTFAADVVAQMLQNVPEVLRSSQELEVPPVIAALLEFRKKALDEARTALSKPGSYGEQAVRGYERQIAFWEKEFEAAWKLRGMGLHAASLDVACPLGD